MFKPLTLHFYTFKMRELQPLDYLTKQKEILFFLSKVKFKYITNKKEIHLNLVIMTNHYIDVTKKKKKKTNRYIG